MPIPHTFPCKHYASMNPYTFGCSHQHTDTFMTLSSYILIYSSFIQNVITNLLSLLYAGVGSAQRDNDARVAWALRTAVARVVASHINAFRQVRVGACTCKCAVVAPRCFLGALNTIFARAVATSTFLGRCVCRCMQMQRCFQQRPSRVCLCVLDRHVRRCIACCI